MVSPSNEKRNSETNFSKIVLRLSKTLIEKGFKLYCSIKSILRRNGHLVG